MANDDKFDNEMREKVNFVFDLLQGLLQGQNKVTSLSFSDWFHDWFERYKRPNLKDSSIRLDIRYIESLCAEFGSLPLAGIVSDQLQNYLLKIPGNNTRKKVYTILNEAFKKAVDLYMISRNPCSAVEIPAYRVRHYRALEFSEQNAVLKAHKEDSYYYHVFKFLCCTGMRIGEFLAFDFNTDIDYKNNLIFVSKSIDRETGKVVLPKTESGIRRFVFDDSLLSTIFFLKMYFQNGGCRTYTAIRQHFDRLYKRLRIKGANLHSMRHTFISVCHMENIPVKYIQKIVGHSKAEMTLDVYAHDLLPGTSFVREYVRKLKLLLLG